MKTPTPTKARISRVWIERKRDRNMIGTIAKAEVISAGGVRQTLHSWGLWAIPDFDSLYAECKELALLRSELASFGFGQRAIDYAFKRVERKEIE